MFSKNGLSYKELNQELINKVIAGEDINEKTILNSTNYIKSEERNANGIFYTPMEIVDETYRYLDKSFGKTWKSRYHVWDCSCGKANLTKNYKIKNLYLSTLEKTDIDFNKVKKYNENATHFQFDFLNDPIEKLPNVLLDNLKSNKPFLFIINPPFAIDINTKYSNMMQDDNYSHYVYRLTHLQFLYRIIEIKNKFNLKNVNIAFISPLSFLSKKTFKDFRKILFNNFELTTGFVFNSKLFNVKYGNWLAATSIFRIGKRKNLESFEYDIYQTNEKKTIYNIQKEDSAINYLSRNSSKIRKLEHIKTVPLRSATEVNKDNEEVTRFTSPINSLGFYVVTSNNVNASNYSYILSSQPGKSYGLHIMDFNLKEISVNFVTRKAVKKDWLNCYDEYLKPEIGLKEKEEFKIFEDDAIIYSIFNNSSHQSALRNLKYKDEIYNVNNEWFWINKNEVKYLAEKYNYLNVLNDLNNSKNSYLYENLDSLNISKEAKNVLRLSHEIFESSFEYREKYSIENPNKQLDCWDAGWQQLRHMIKREDPMAFKIFSIAYTRFENKLKEQVYKFKLLK